MIRRLGSASVWAAGVVPTDDPWRNAKRIWLPLFDVIMITSGINAIVFGSLLLDRLYGDFTDIIGAAFVLVAAACLIGVVWPRMWPVEIVGKILLVSMIVGYVAAIILSPSPEQLVAKEAPNWFIVSMILGLIVLPIMRLDNLIDEWVERRAKRRWEAADE
ncbi:hypothetical protein F6X37_32405 [Paraburkholderia sp. 31.1]|uniref:hypothetical protein n=1 Tax=Paraburkholderia sp. 31.1 TaxID=2615205 RepID=UPI001655B3DA|nr:hypothetical protein [Paraburkholderia sp. 31.1]MBC8726071.1 hypothetical protein [Paraburkholderia sp. 31.1]